MGRAGWGVLAAWAALVIAGGLLLRRRDAWAAGTADAAPGRPRYRHGPAAAPADGPQL